MRLGLPPSAEGLRASGGDWRTLRAGTVLWRVHRTAGPNVVGWNQLRYWGPSGARFDPHVPPRSESEIGVSYTATDVASALAEVFQDRRVVNTIRRAPYLTAWRTGRRLRLLDLAGTWPVRHGASHAINTGRHDLCRAWARAIYQRWPALDGLHVCSAMTGRPCVVLWSGAADSFPAAPSFSAPLSDPALRPYLYRATQEIGYTLL